MKFIDLTGKVFGKLTVLCRSNKETSRPYWVCLCECGRKKDIRGSSLGTQSLSCGCAISEKQLRAHPLYDVWSSMKKRCLCSTCCDYTRYGGRGITVCESWLDFECFVKDMGHRPDGASLDRIDNNGNYCKENCRWASRIQQNNNRRDTVFATAYGMCKPITEWSGISGIKSGTILARIRSGWPEKLAVFAPVGYRRPA